MVKNRWIATLAALNVATALIAAEFPAGTEIKPEGQFKFAGQEFAVVHFNSAWLAENQTKSSVTPASGYPRRNNGSFELKGRFCRGLAIDEKIVAAGSDSIRYSCRLTSPTGVATNDLALALTMPVESFSGNKIICDGKIVVMPETFDEKHSNRLFSGRVSTISLPVENGRLEISGQLDVLLQDDRQYHLDGYSLRLRFDGVGGTPEVKDATIKLTMTLKGYPSVPVDISSRANMGFVDDVAGDRRGGWTDQGPDNDLRMLTPGDYNFCGLKFRILDRKQHPAGSCIVLNGPSNPYFPQSVTLPGHGLQGVGLYLLHATGWTPAGEQVIGTVTVEYADGTRTRAPVRTRHEVGNWWGPISLPNGLVVWQAENQYSTVGLYLSKFKLEPKPIKNITLASTEKCLWLIPALTITTVDVPLPRQINRPVLFTANAEWQPFSYEHDIIGGSIMDFSSLLDAPAGKYGPVTIKNGHFVFAAKPETRLRFYGANLCFSSNFMSREQCEKLAERLARMGYNSVRFHHFDATMTRPDGKNGVVLVKDKMDQLDYLFYCLKQRGLYLTIDLYTIRQLAKGEIKAFPDLAVGPDQFKGLAFINDEVMANWEDFSRKFLTHVNPYTGLAWKDDPALISISLINEDTVFAVAERDSRVARLYEQQFAAWLKKQGLSEASADQRPALKKRFLIEVYNRAYARMAAFMRSLGVRLPLTDQNMWNSIDMSLMRQHYDYVDNHGYWDHPSFPVDMWRFPVACRNKSDISQGAPMPVEAGPSRLFGKPMMYTEFDFVSPNRFRAESGLVMGAYSALQDWDGIYRFAYSHGDIAYPTPVGMFDVFSSPLSAIAEKMGILCFLRGDVSRAPVCFPTLISATPGRSIIPDSYPSSVWNLGLVGRTGTVVVAQSGKITLPSGTVAVTGGADLAQRHWGVPYAVAWPGHDALGTLRQQGILNPGSVDAERQEFRSAGGELTLNRKEGTFTVITPRSEGAVLPEGKSMSGKVLTIGENTAYAAFYATAMDGRELASSRKILLLHLTDVQNTRAKFGSPALTLWLERGQLPYLIRKGEATIRLKGNFTGCRLYAVNLAGKRLAEVPLTRTAAEIRFKADTHMRKNGVAAYELTGNP